jgi:protein phosphatase-4 regulatory subunit 3
VARRGVGSGGGGREAQTTPLLVFAVWLSSAATSLARQRTPTASQAQRRMAETQTDQSQPVTHRQISSDEHTPTSSASPHDPSTAGPPLGDTLPALDATPARLDAGESVPDAPLPSSPSGSSASASPSSPAHASTSAGAEASGSTPQRTQRSPQNNSPSGVAGGSSSPQGSPSQSSPQGSPSQGSARRVKLYRLQDVEWLDLGTGNCVGHFVDGPPTTISISPRQSVTLDEGAWILVTREAEDGNEPEMILKSKIRPYPPGYLSDDEGDDDGDEVREGRVLDTGGYLKQQETLIVWTEDDTEHEMALSFATVGGCAEIWEFIKAARKWSSESHPGVLEDLD